MKINIYQMKNGTKYLRRTFQGTDLKACQVINWETGELIDLKYGKYLDLIQAICASYLLSALANQEGGYSVEVEE